MAVALEAFQVVPGWKGKAKTSQRTVSRFVKKRLNSIIQSREIDEFSSAVLRQREMQQQKVGLETRL